MSEEVTFEKEPVMQSFDNDFCVPGAGDTDRNISDPALKELTF